MQNQFVRGHACWNFCQLLPCCSLDRFALWLTCSCINRSEGLLSLQPHLHQNRRVTLCRNHSLTSHIDATRCFHLHLFDCFRLTFLQELLRISVSVHEGFKVFAFCQYYFQKGLFLSTFKLYRWGKELDTIWTIFITLIEIYKIFANLIGQNDLNAFIYMSLITNMLKIKKNLQFCALLDHVVRPFKRIQP